MMDNYSISNINQRDYPVIQNIKNELITFDKDLQEKKFDDIFLNFDKGLKLCERLKIKAVKKNDEYCANCSFLLKTNFALIFNIAKFWKYCEEYDYNEAWIYLQNALDETRFSLKFLDNNCKDEIIKTFEYLSIIEKLFPYQLFNSTAIEDVEVKCSICNKSPFDPECNHIEGELYWGEPVFNIVTKIGRPNHVLICPNPMDKRCIIYIKYDQNHPEESPFAHVYYFIKKSGRPLKHFKYKISEKQIRRSTYENNSGSDPLQHDNDPSVVHDDNDIKKIPHYDFYFEES
jgi:hypothetical protein